MKTTQIGRLWMFTLAALCLGLAPVRAQDDMGDMGSMSGQRVTLREGQQIQLKLADDLRSNGSRVGQEVRFYVNQDVMGPNGEKLIFKGARASGRVSEVRKARRLGRKGVINFTVDSVMAIDGTRVPLRAQKTASSNNRGRRGAIAGAAVLLSPAALLVRGRNIAVKKGTLVNAYIDGRAAIRPAM